ncbi:DnaB-like helicase N-terminal domain-containing protein [Terrisporobacter sp.]|uniref:DnaB-like helicase N-terminal domain-containing protein n=1 Tax=Terrisporobacter sp. TaxID=1965305 RepID=UPI00261CC2BF|nr:DnaB-like helicase N-terminal domain-containing protein [Terrisporobacter sp.]
MSTNIKIPPHSVEAEQTVLGSILLDNKIISRASKRIKTDIFYKESHRIIYENILNLYKRGDPIDLIMLSEELKNNNVLIDVGGMSYISSLLTIVPSTSNIDYYIDLLQDKYSRRQALIEISTMENDLYNGKIEALTGGIDNLKSILMNNKNIENLYVDASQIKRNKSTSMYISTGFKDLDNMLGGGFKYTSLNIITGVPGSGKSTIINQIIAGAIKDGNKSFLYSGELPESDLMFWFNRTVANECHLEEKNSKLGKKYIDVTDYCWDLISKWVKDKFKVYDSDSIANKDNILSVMEYLAVNKDIKLFVLDNLMTFDIGDHSEQYRKQKQLCLGLKQLAKKYDLIVLLVAHPKKTSKGEGPSMYDVSGASEIVGSADSVIRTERVIRDDGEEESKLLLLKNRWGGITNRAVRVTFDKYRKRFYTCDEELNRDFGYDENKRFLQMETDDMPF